MNASLKVRTDLEDSCLLVIRNITLNLINENRDLLSWHISDVKKFLFTPVTHEFLIQIEMTVNMIGVDMKNVDFFRDAVDSVTNINALQYMMDIVLSDIFLRYEESKRYDNLRSTSHNTNITGEDK